MNDYTIDYFWKDMSGKRRDRKDFQKIEDAVEYTYSMRRNPLVKDLSYELVEPVPSKKNISYA